VEVVVTVGRDINPAQFGLQPAHVSTSSSGFGSHCCCRTPTSLSAAAVPRR
jgi:hypothetical protein